MAFALWSGFNVVRDAIKPAWKPTLTFHSQGGWRCYRSDTGIIGYGETAQDAYRDLWHRLFS
jgi:hypothetical protein